MSSSAPAQRTPHERLNSIALLRALLFALAIFATWHWWHLLHTDLQNYDRGLPGAGFGLACAALAVARPSRLPDSWRQDLLAWLKAHRYEIAAVLALTALSAFMRLYDLNSFPTRGYTGFEENQTGGIAYRIVKQDLMPTEFAFTNYAAALGFWLFGFTAWAMRAVFIVTGILSVVPMYLVLRRLVAMPPALLTTLFFAACRWLAVTSRFADEALFGVSLVIPAVYLLLLVIQNRSGLAALGLGILCAMLSYEYTCYRELPYFIVATLGVGILVESYRQVKQHSPAKLLPLVPMALAFVIGAFVILIPLIAATEKGDVTYMEAFHRHLDNEPHPAIFGLLPPDWSHRAQHALRTFSPFRTDPGEDWRPLNGQGKIWFDPLTASLAIPAMCFAFLTFWRPYRLFFAAWLVVGIFVGGVIPIHFNDQRFTGLIPAMFVLIAFLFDGLLKLCRPPALRRAALVGMAGLGLFAVAANAQALDTQVHDAGQQAFFRDPILDVCYMARSLGPSAYVYISTDDQSTDAIFTPSDWTWACHDINGEPFDPTARVWPLPGPAVLTDNVGYIVMEHADTPSPIVRRLLTLPFARKIEHEDVNEYHIYGIVVGRRELLAKPSAVTSP